MEKESLDVYCYDSYPDFAFGLDRDPLHSDDLNDRKWSHNLAEIRSIALILELWNSSPVEMAGQPEWKHCLRVRDS